MPDEKPEFTDADVRRFLKWKGEKSPWEVDFALAKQENLRSFREKYGVDKASNFHCPWCWTGRLYELLEEPGIYACRQCELKWEIHSKTPEALTVALEAKAEERRQKREERKADRQKPQVEGFPEEVSPKVQLLLKQAEETGHIECLGCKSEIPSDVDYCTCGWKNPLVSLGLI